MVRTRILFCVAIFRRPKKSSCGMSVSTSITHKHIPRRYIRDNLRTKKREGARRFLSEHIIYRKPNYNKFTL